MTGRRIGWRTPKPAAACSTDGQHPQAAAVVAWLHTKTPAARTLWRAMGSADERVVIAAVLLAFRLAEKWEARACPLSRTQALS